MLKLKDYQQRTLDALRDYLREVVKRDNANEAFYHFTRRTYCQAPGMRKDLPYVCLRIPTGGGKTLVAAHAVSVTAGHLLHADRAVVLWLAPSNTIRDQTIKALRDRNHPYRQALDATVGTVSVLDVDEALAVSLADLNTSTVIVVATMQSFRVANTDDRRVYENSGGLMDHFRDIPAEAQARLEKGEGGNVLNSLANVLHLRRPIVIVDEAHNARTGLSFETLRRFDPSCIVEFTATPAQEENPSNVLFSVSAAELKAEEMIKLPIRLTVRGGDWRELLALAIAQRNALEAAAGRERQETREYMRPIMLIQAQPHRQGQETVTPEVVKACLVGDCRVPEDQVAIATGTTREIEEVDLAADSCPVRYIITMQALREGWDCPFAYVLCTVADTRSPTAVEQILGRVLRLPAGRRKRNAELNVAYAFTNSDDFRTTANSLREALVHTGFDKQEAEDFVVPGQEPEQMEADLAVAPGTPPVVMETPETPRLELLPDAVKAKVEVTPDARGVVINAPLTEKDALDLKACFQTKQGKAFVEQMREKSRSLLAARRLSPSQRGVRFDVPLLAIKQGDLFEPFEDTHFLDHPWDLRTCDPALTESEYSGKVAPAVSGEIDVRDNGHLSYSASEVQQQLSVFADQGYTVAALAAWLDRQIHHPDVTPEQSGIFLVNAIQSLMDQRALTVGDLARDKYRLRNALEGKIDEYRLKARGEAYQMLLLPECATPLTVTPEVCFSFPPEDSYGWHRLYRGRHQFKKHYYEQVGDLDDHGEEFECACFIDQMEEVDCWVRNVERAPLYSFWLQTKTDRFYPDFVCKLKDGRILVLEYKGEDRWSNDDSKEKRALGELWAERSNGKCLFLMASGTDYVHVVPTVCR